MGRTVKQRRVEREKCKLSFPFLDNCHSCTKHSRMDTHTSNSLVKKQVMQEHKTQYDKTGQVKFQRGGSEGAVHLKLGH